MTELQNKKFGKLLILGKSEKRGNRGEFYWLCLCDCGKRKVIRQDCLTQGRALQCGCSKNVNLTGKTFNLLTVVKELARRTKTNGEKYWLCKCICGKQTQVTTSCLTKLKTKSCGCLVGRKQNQNPNFKGVGEISSDFWFRIKKEAIGRKFCFEITIQQAWDLFLKQNRKCAMSGVELKFEPSRKLRAERTASLDRIDSKKGYTLDNIQWLHKNVNQMKMALPQVKFIEWCKLVTSHNKCA